MFRSIRVGVLLCATACGGSQPEPAARSLHSGTSTGNGASDVTRSVPALSASHILSVPGGTYGPFLGARPGAQIAVWAAEDGNQRHWYTLPLNDRGEAGAEERKIAPAAPEVGLVAVKPLAAQGSKAGFIVVTSSREFQGVRVDALALGTAGELRGGPFPIAQSLPEVVWLDAVPTANGAIILWAVRKGANAEIVATHLGPNGDPQGAPNVIINEALAWQAAAVPRGAAVAAVTAHEAAASRGSIELSFVDENARSEGTPKRIAEGVNAELDLDLARIGGQLMLAWSDRRGLEPRIFSARVDDLAKVTREPEPLTPPFGPQALIRLIPGAKPDLPGFVVWENLVEKPEYGRHLRIGSIKPDGTLGGEQAILQFAGDDGGVPELATTTRGLGALTLAPACHVGRTCKTADSVPTFVQFDNALSVVASEPLRLAPLRGQLVELVWGLSCGIYQCVALAAQPRSPAPVFAVQLGGVSNHWKPAGWRHSLPKPPRAAAVTAIGSAATLSDIATARVGARTLTAWLTYFDETIPYARPEKPAPDGRYAPVRAILSVRSLADEGRHSEPQVVSYRARSIGGLALSPGEAGQALLVWTALENGQAQVFTTLLADTGQKVRQQMLTHDKGSPSEVAATFVGDGWIIAWIDERGGSPEVRLTKVDKNLRRVTPERTLTHAVGNASQVRLLARGKHVFAAWTDARGNNQSVGNLYIARVSADRAEPIGPERQLTRTATHSHSPALSAYGEGALIAWMEEEIGSERGPVQVMIQRLDSGAEAASDPVLLAQETAPAAVTLDCTASECRAVTASWQERVGKLRALRFNPANGNSTGRTLAALGKQAQDVIPPAIVGQSLFYADTTPDGAALVHHMSVEWE